MNQPTEHKIQKLLDLLQEFDVITKRAILTCQEVERSLRGELNDDDLPPAA